MVVVTSWQPITVSFVSTINKHEGHTEMQSTQLESMYTARSTHFHPLSFLLHNEVSVNDPRLIKLLLPIFKENNEVNTKCKIYNSTSPNGSNTLATVCPMFRYWT
jgi:hypothetical protein